MSKTDFQNGFALGMATGGVVEVVDTTEIDALETLIDESGVLEDTEGTVSITEKVEKLLHLAFLMSNSRALQFTGDTKIQEVYFDCKNIITLYDGFRNTKVTTIKLKNTQNVTGWANAFASNSIISIEMLDLSGATSTIPANAFSAHSLKHLKIKPLTIKQSATFWGAQQLNADSIQSIVDGLAPITTTRTLSMSTAFDDGERLTDDRKAQIEAKGWTLVIG